MSDQRGLRRRLQRLAARLEPRTEVTCEVVSAEEAEAFRRAGGYVFTISLGDVEGNDDDADG